MNGLLLLLLGGLAAIGIGGGGGGSASTTTGRGGDDSDEPAPPAAPTIADGPGAPPADRTPPEEEDRTPPEDDGPPASDDGGGPRAGSGAPDVPDSAFDIGWEGLSAEEQLIVELVNRARMDPRGELGRQDEGFASGVSTAPKEVLAVVQTLSDASEAHSEDMDNRDFFAHQNPDGESHSDRALEAGHGSRFVGENIGWIGSTRTSFDEQARAQDHHDNLWDSDGHQRNFMSDNWNEIGVGYDYGDYLGYSGSTFVTEMFGDRGETYLTGVVIDDGDGDDFYDIGEGQGGVQITAYDGDEVFTTATWDSGGYTLALPPGTYRVVFEGGDLDTPYETDVTIGSENVKLDVIDGRGTAFATLSAGPEAELSLLPEIAAEESQVAAMEEEEELLLF